MISTRRLNASLKVALQGHLFNWPWRPRAERRRVRGEVTRKVVLSYLDRYVPAFCNVAPDEPDASSIAASSGTIVSSSNPAVYPASAVPAADEKIFSIWLQGEQNEPPVVRSCLGSIRANCSRELVVLDSSSLPEWIQLPGYIVDKWKSGKMRHAHFSDICRLELLYRYGGLWMDATDFVTADIPAWIWDEDFFLYTSGDKVGGSYSFVQNCFIRARKGNYLVKAWREAAFEYWKHEDSTIDYYTHQLLFEKVVECNPLATELFEKMPKHVQDPTHDAWFIYGSKPFDAASFAEICSRSAFQKTEFKSARAISPVPGSFNDEMIKMYR